MEQIGGLILYCLVMLAVIYFSAYKGKGKQEVKEIKPKIKGLEQYEIDTLNWLNSYYDKSLFKVESLCTIKNNAKVMTFTITPITKKDNK